MARLIEHGIKGRGPGYRFATADYDIQQAILVFAGGLRAEIAGAVQAVTPGMLLWLPPGAAFVLSCPTGSYRGVFAIASGGDLERGQAWVAPAPPQLLAVAEAMRAPAGGSVAAQEHLAWALLALAGSCRADVGDAWAARLRQAIDVHLGDQLPVQELCSGWAIGYRQLSRRFVAVYGRSPKAFQQERRLERARERLAGGRGSVTDVALDLGFASSQHFAARFRARFGMTPRQARESVSGAGASSGAAPSRRNPDRSSRR